LFKSAIRAAMGAASAGVIPASAVTSLRGVTSSRGVHHPTTNDGAKLWPRHSTTSHSSTPSIFSLLALSPVVLLVFLLSSAPSPASCGPAEDRLIATVLKGYNPLARPVDGDQASDVWFGMGLIQILQIIEVEQTVKANVWLRLIWEDPRLSWDESEYDGVPNIRLPFDSVWNPEIVLFNNANGVYEVNYKSNVVVYPTGYVLWVPPALFVSSCSIDVRYFPFDEQKCEMIFGSWTYNSDQVRHLWYDGGTTTSNPFAVVNDYARSGSWDVTLAPGIIKTDEKRKLTTTVFFLHLRRKTLFFILNLIIPCVVIAILCWFTFLLPSTSGEKVGYAITLLLGLMVFLLLLFTVLPATSESVPLMAQFLLFIYIVNVVSIILCVWIIGYSFRLPSTHFMSSGVKALFLDLLPPLIRMKRPEGEPHVHEPRFQLDESIKAEEIRAAAITANTGASSASSRGGGHGSGNLMMGSGGPRSRFGERGMENLVNRKYGVSGSGFGSLESNVLTGGGLGGLHRSGGGGTSGNNNNEALSATALSAPLSSDVIEAAKDIRYIAERASGNNEDDQVAGDWMYIGLVLDSFTFWVTGLVIVAGTAYFLMSAPNSFGSVDQIDLIDNWDANHCRIFFAGDYNLFSYTTADTVTINTMQILCCGVFFSPKFASKSSKYSNETASTQEINFMEKLCAEEEDEQKERRKRDVGEAMKEEDDEEGPPPKVSPGVRAGGGGFRIPATQSGTKFDSRNLAAEFAAMGLDFEAEWKTALRENLVLMRNGEAEMRKVDELAKRPPRSGLRHNATNVG